jgi:AraC family transcriptional regulator, alkane utilization regulator
MDPLTQFQEDVLGDVLRSIHLHSTLYCRAQLGAPWGLGVPRREVAVFHIVTAGTCWLTVEGINTPMPLSAGKLMILPHGHAHAIADHPDTPVTGFVDFVSQHPTDKNGMVHGGGEGAVTTLVCGEFQLEEYATNPLFSLLPTCLCPRSQHVRSIPWVRAIVKLVKAEASGVHPGAAAVITRLSEILFIQAVREYLSTADATEAGWLGALKDPQIGQALALMHLQPSETWTVESLASRVGLSRSAFSAHFTRLVGVPPMHYLTGLRLTKAASLLRTLPATLIEVALAVGYDSDVALSKAFKRRFGIAPGAYRRGSSALRVLS